MRAGARKGIRRGAVVAAALVLGIGCFDLDVPRFGENPEPPSTRAEWEITILRFGRSGPRPKRQWVERAKEGERIAPVWMYWLLRSGDRTVIVDPGFVSDETARSLHVTEHVRPDTVLAEVGLEPGDVTDVLLTHFALSRAEAVELYPNARFFVQSAAFERARSYVWASPSRQRRFPVRALRFLMEADERGRLVRVDTTFEILDGIKAHDDEVLGRWYTYYSVNTKAGVWVIAGDLVPLRENVRRNRWMPGVKRGYSRRTYVALRRLANGSTRILPAVDPKVEERFERISEHAFRVTPAD